MNKFQAMTVFTRVAECNGFSAAGRKMGMSASAVTKMVGRLEDDLGVQLFNRTTRRLALTDFGQEFYARSVRILSELEDAESTLRDASETPRGVIRAVVPFSFGRVTLMPALPRFCEEYPDINLDLTFNDAPVDLIEEGFDVGIRTGLLNDSRLMTQELVVSAWPIRVLGSPRSSWIRSCSPLCRSIPVWIGNTKEPASACPS